jgi:hypothetical protein
MGQGTPFHFSCAIFACSAVRLFCFRFLSSRFRFKKQWAFLLVQALNLLLLAACGNIGDPLPPLIQIPKPVSDLAAVQFGKQVKLSWTLPKFNIDGSEATTLARLEIYRLSTQPGSAILPEKDQFGHSATKWRVIEKNSFDSYRVGEKLVLTDRLAGLDDKEIFQNEFSYAIKAINRKAQDAGYSNLTRLRIYPVACPPEGVQALLAEHFIELSWKPPAYNIDGSTPVNDVKFNVYRSEGSKANVKELLTKMPTAGRSFKDESMVLGKTYYYAIRSVTNTPSGLIESLDSTEVGVTNSDVYPPIVPAEVTAISNGQSISLVWLPNAESDLAGYYVYRSGEEHHYKKLTQERITTASYTDSSVEKGKTYYYRIKAVDTSGNESDYSEEVSDKVE